MRCEQDTNFKAYIALTFTPNYSSALLLTRFYKSSPAIHLHIRFLPFPDQTATLQVFTI